MYFIVWYITSSRGKHRTSSAFGRFPWFHLRTSMNSWYLGNNLLSFFFSHAFLHLQHVNFHLFGGCWFSVNYILIALFLFLFLFSDMHVNRMPGARMSSQIFMIFEVAGGIHDDVIKWKHFPRYLPFVRGVHRSLVNSPYFETPSHPFWCHCNGQLNGQFCLFPFMFAFFWIGLFLGGRIKFSLLCSTSTTLGIYGGSHEPYVPLNSSILEIPNARSIWHHTCLCQGRVQL